MRAVAVGYVPATLATAAALSKDHRLSFPGAANASKGKGCKKAKPSTHPFQGGQ